MRLKPAACPGLQLAAIWNALPGQTAGFHASETAKSAARLAFRRRFRSCRCSSRFWRPPRLATRSGSKQAKVDVSAEAARKEPRSPKWMKSHGLAAAHGPGHVCGRVEEEAWPGASFPPRNSGAGSIVSRARPRQPEGIGIGLPSDPPRSWRADERAGEHVNSSAGGSAPDRLDPPSLEPNGAAYTGPAADPAQRRPAAARVSRSRWQVRPAGRLEPLLQQTAPRTALAAQLDQEKLLGVRSRRRSQSGDQAGSRMATAALTLSSSSRTGSSIRAPLSFAQPDCPLITGSALVGPRFLWAEARPATASEQSRWLEPPIAASVSAASLAVYT